MNKTIILISGKARAGKDTFALGLDGYNKYSFAGQLKDFAIKLGWNGHKDERGRKFLQDLASTVREYNRNTWVNLVCRMLETNSYPNQIAITDCRYLNEIQIMRQWGKKNGYKVITVRIERPNYDNGLTEEQKNHPSETELDGFCFDHIIENSGTIGDLICIASSCFASGAYSDLTSQDGCTSF